MGGVVFWVVATVGAGLSSSLRGGGGLWLVHSSLFFMSQRSVLSEAALARKRSGARDEGGNEG